MADSEGLGEYEGLAVKVGLGTTPTKGQMFCRNAKTKYALAKTKITNRTAMLINSFLGGSFILIFGGTGGVASGSEFVFIFVSIYFTLINF
jgi:hypothetical protein